MKHSVFIDAVDRLDEQPSKEDAKAMAKREAQKNQERRDREKREVHDYKEAERQDIRTKYQLPKHSNAAQKPSNVHKSRETESSSEKSCTVC